eukprot:CAMPEP_0202447540 /NCGR_PEP_ID=MMETSP1360-20130828/6304_1 /ASSEMBLY_ACC=CAM_ASM_000848 /TAXON_ID=515479 /ORGANISM="Licmophora paradoxa, Strain CCMP2313" /LENGTH=52 /DNA_ID=CAMNT_0049064681 /DNA_START=92 /DNA_END=250 /DNA_ORIENTATION=-
MAGLKSALEGEDLINVKHLERKKHDQILDDGAHEKSDYQATTRYTHMEVLME